MFLRLYILQKTIKIETETHKEIIYNAKRKIRDGCDTEKGQIYNQFITFYSQYYY